MFELDSLVHEVIEEFDLSAHSEEDQATTLESVFRNYNMPHKGGEAARPLKMAAWDQSDSVGV